MNTKLNNIIVFVAGAGIGSLVTWKILEKKYEQIVREEIESAEEYYRNKAFEDYTVKDCAEMGVSVELSERDKEYLEAESERCEEIREGVLMGGAIDVSIPQDYANLASRYTSEEVTEMVDKPYIIAPEEYGEIDEYECISLNYYTDGVVADDFDDIVDDVDEIIGRESLNHFGEYEDDAVFVRNDAKRCDYEILRDTRSFSKDILGED